MDRSGSSPLWLLIHFILLIAAGVLTWSGPSLTYPSFLIRWSFLVKSALFGAIGGLVFGTGQWCLAQSQETDNAWAVFDQALSLLGWILAFMGGNVLVRVVFPLPPAGGSFVSFLWLILRVQLVAFTVGLVGGLTLAFLGPYGQGTAPAKKLLASVAGFLAAGAFSVLAMGLLAISISDPFVTLPITFDRLSLVTLIGGGLFTVIAGIIISRPERILGAT